MLEKTKQGSNRKRKCKWQANEVGKARCRESAAERQR